jgi:excisionase family DNA binding protein
MTANDNNPLSADILQGADAIAAWTGFKRRTIYHAVTKGSLPTFRVGETICARKSTLTKWIETQEKAA